MNIYVEFIWRSLRDLYSKSDNKNVPYFNSHDSLTAI